MTVSPSRFTALWFARSVTEVSAPGIVGVALFLAVGWHSSWPDTGGLLHGAVAAVLSVAVPYAVLIWGVRTGRWSDRHVSRREDRVLPFLITLASVVSGVVFLLWADAYRELTFVAASMLGGLAVTLVVSLVWKVSLHAASAAGAATATVFVFGFPPLVAGVLVALVGWSRVRLGDHTAGQVAVGAVLGVVVASATFHALG